MGLAANGKRDNFLTEPLRGGFRANPADVFRSLYGEDDNACNGGGIDHVLYATITHDDYKGYFGSINNKDVLKALSQSNALNLFIDTPQDRTSILDSFQYAVRNNDILTPPSDRSFAADLQEGAWDYQDKRPCRGDDICRFTGDPDLNKRVEETVGFLEHTASLIRGAAENGIYSYFYYREGAWKDLYDKSKVDCARDGSDHIKNPKACYTTRGKMYEARFEDGGAAFTVNRNMLKASKFLGQGLALEDGGKSLILAGAGHGIGLMNRLMGWTEDGKSVKEEEAVKPQVLKITESPNYDAYHASGHVGKTKEEVGALALVRFFLEGVENGIEKTGIEIPPALVYLREEGVFLTTTATPPHIVKMFEKEYGALQSYEDLVKDKTVSISESMSAPNEDMTAYIASSVNPVI